jgi:hypothetical protein
LYGTYQNLKIWYFGYHNNRGPARARATRRTRARARGLAHVLPTMVVKVSVNSLSFKNEFSEGRMDLLAIVE